MVVVVFGLVGTVILVVGWGPVGSGTGGSQGVQVEGLGVLHLGGLDRDSVVDDWNVLGSMPGSGSVPGVGGWGGVPSGNGDWGWVSGAGSGMGGKVLGLGVLNFGGISGTDSDQTAGLLVSGKVFGLGGGHLGGVGRDVVPVGGRGGGSQQQNGSYDESFHFC